MISGGCLHGACTLADMGGSSGGTATLVLEHPEIANVISAKLEARRTDAFRVGRGRRLAGKLLCIVVCLLFGGIGISTGRKLPLGGIVERLGADGGLAKLLGGYGGRYAGFGGHAAVMLPLAVEATSNGQDSKRDEGVAGERREQDGKERGHYEATFAVQPTQGRGASRGTPHMLPWGQQ